MIEIQSGIDSKGRCVIAMSSMAYDMLIEECRFIRNEVAKTKDNKLKLKAAQKVAMIITIAGHPKFEEIKNSN